MKHSRKNWSGVPKWRVLVTSVVPSLLYIYYVEKMTNDKKTRRKKSKEGKEIVMTNVRMIMVVDVGGGKRKYN